jgi:hypothetical protein
MSKRIQHGKISKTMDLCLLDTLSAECSPQQALHRLSQDNYECMQMGKTNNKTSLSSHQNQQENSTPNFQLLLLDRSIIEES